MRRVERSHGCEVTNRSAGDGRPVVLAADGVDGPQQRRHVRPTIERQVTAQRAAGVDVAKARVRRQVVAIGVDVLAEQGDVEDTRGGQGASLGDHVIERADCAPVPD